ncbi:uncharacterized protein I206_106339 [Kwoniella pini CBS 10737]|uniref:Uncharacterized protein n=1 Tax=Kwoniella pini CBS 10737 TaxID=1296096 RepID=A0A1B9HU08_9TREE|nr:uncharacterized protein I206_07141 [Kwoniella pini CBS 10737]OCF46754.1 hypothetical protein I206_07141 [Kwoniella pini CBS 10737]
MSSRSQNHSKSKLFTSVVSKLSRKSFQSEGNQNTEQQDQSVESKSPNTVDMNSKVSVERDENGYIIIDPKEVSPINAESTQINEESTQKHEESNDGSRDDQFGSKQSDNTIIDRFRQDVENYRKKLGLGYSENCDFGDASNSE